MGLYEHWPYTNFHELNLDYILKEMREMYNRIENYVSQLGIKYADPFDWDITHQYEQNTLVMEPISGTAYLSLQPVPSGINITNTDYWTPVFSLGDLVEGIREGTARAVENSAYATQNYDEGDLIWVDKYLVIATSPIAAGSAFSPGGNCESISIEELLKDIDTRYASDIQDLQNADITLQNNIDGEVTNRQNADITLQNNINAEVTNRTNADNGLKTYIDNKLANIIYFPTPELFGAVGDGITDDTQAFQDMAAFAESSPGDVYIPNKTYYLTDVVFGDSDIIKNEGTFNGKHYIGRNNSKVIPAASNLTPFRTISRPSGFYVQAICYDPNSDIFYVGYANSDNSAQKIYKVDSSWAIVATCDLAVSGLHLNTLTYNNKTNELLTIESAGYNLLKIDFVNETVSTKHTFTEFNAGVQYDQILDVYVGVAGPNITNQLDWYYYIYDNDFTEIRRGRFRNPGNTGINETPNGFCAWNGKMVHSSFNTVDGTLGSTNTQFIFDVDYFGNVGNVHEQFFGGSEYEGIAYKAGVYYTVSDLTATGTQFTAFSADLSFSPSLKSLEGRNRINPSYVATYVASGSNAFFRADTANHIMYVSGYIQLVSGSMGDDTERTIGTIQEGFRPANAHNVVIPVASGSANVGLVITGSGELKLITSDDTSVYINLGGCYQY